MTTIEFVTIEVGDVAEAEAFLPPRSMWATGCWWRELRTEPVIPGVHAIAGGVAARHRPQPDQQRRRHGSNRAETGREVAMGLRRDFRAPDGTIWTVASPSKKDTGPATRKVDEFVLQLGVADVTASKQFYAHRGFSVGRAMAADTSSSIRAPWP